MNDVNSVIIFDGCILNSAGFRYISMKFSYYKILVIVYVALLQVMCGCKDDKSNCMELKRLDIALSDYSILDSIGRDSVISNYEDALGVWLKIMGHNELCDSVLDVCSKTRAMKVFAPDIQCYFVAEDSVEKVLFLLEENTCNLLGDSIHRDYYSVVSPFNQSIYISDQMVFVALNHYLGEDYPGYGYFDAYQRITKTERHLPYDVAESIIQSKFPYELADGNTVCNELLYQGAVIVAVMETVPNADLAEALGYTKAQMQWVEDNEKEAWNALISRRLLYSTSKYDADRLIKPAPTTAILHQQSPGRMGRYIGFRIVKSYIDNNEVTDISELLQPSFYNNGQSLIKSKYRGVN